MNLFLAMCSLYKRQHPDREKCTGGVQQAHSSTGTKCTGLIQCAGCAKRRQGLYLPANAEQPVVASPRHRHERRSPATPG
eukprot:gene22066-biopygen2700